jgi:arylsulfatase A-like enzyme
LEEVDLEFLKRSQNFLEQYVRESPDRPFFLFHSMQAVHLPSFAARRFQGKSNAGPHGDFLLQMDAIVGELMETLRRLGVDKNTLVLFTSDNGPEVTSVVHMRADYGHDGARPWRGVKRDQWEGGHRVPLIARWPNRIPSNTTSSQLASLTDVMATVASVVGVELPTHAAEDSFNLLPAFLDANHPPIRPYLLTQAFGGSKTLAIRRGAWKYIDHVGSGGNRYDSDRNLKQYALPEAEPNAPGQLYNLANDPGETKNLYFAEEQIATELKSLLERSKSAGRSR